jgi:hypothetical protein
MRYWLREVAGWGVVAIGLWVFYLCYGMLRNHYVMETGALTVIGIFLFRGGIHMLKMAVAAQVCLEAQQRAQAERPPARPEPKPARPWDRASPGRRLP